MTTPGDPDWADEDRLDRAFSRWFPDLAGDAPDEPPTAGPETPAAGPEPGPELADEADDANEGGEADGDGGVDAGGGAAPPAEERGAWTRGDDDVLPPRRGRRWRRR